MSLPAWLHSDTFTKNIIMISILYSFHCQCSSLCPGMQNKFKILTQLGTCTVINNHISTPCKESVREYMNEKYV